VAYITLDTLYAVFLYNICCFNEIHTTDFPLSLSTSGGASYGAKRLKPSPDFAQVPRFLCKVMLSPVTTITKCHHRRPTFNCELQKNAFGGRAPPGPAGGAITALPRPPSWI